mgnify:FL=1
MPTKYYAVKIGRKPGIYRNWDECKAQVNGYPGAVYKSFIAEFEALEFIGAVKETTMDKPHKMSLTVFTDGSFDGICGGWGFIMLHGENPLIQVYGPCTKDYALRNIGGEIEAAEEAIRKAADFGADHICVYHDYEGIGRWGDSEWKCNNPETKAYRDFISEMRKKLDIDFIKVKGHDGNHYNEIADQLANSGRIAERICVMDPDGEVLNEEDEEFLVEEQAFLASKAARTTKS